MRFLPALLPLVLLLAACNSAAPAADPTPAPPPASATTQPQATQPTRTAPAACPTTFPTGAIPGASTVRTITSAGRPREYRLHLPATAVPGQPLPVVLNFHGLGSNALEQELYSGLAPLSDREGFILVSPDGTGTPRNFAAFGSLLTGVDDVRFTRDLLDALQSELCIDPARVYSTGFSNGAFMSSLLACNLGDRIAAIAPVSGLYFPSGSCAKPTSILAFHGTVDTTVPFEAGSILGILQYVGARASAKAWSQHLGCKDTPTVSQVSPAVAKETYEGCQGKLALYVITGGGHTWPGAPALPTLGPVTQEISASELIWAFFKDNPRR